MNVELAKAILWEFTKKGLLNHHATFTGNGEVWAGDRGGIQYIDKAWWNTRRRKFINNEFELIETIAAISSKATVFMANPKFKPPSSNG